MCHGIAADTMFVFDFPSSKKYLSLVALAIVVRPTALIVWLPLLIYHFWRDAKKLRLVVHDYIPIGLIHLHSFIILIWLSVCVEITVFLSSL